MRSNAHLLLANWVKRACASPQSIDGWVCTGRTGRKCAFPLGETPLPTSLWWSIPRGRNTVFYRGPNSPRWLWIRPGAPPIQPPQRRSDLRALLLLRCSVTAHCLLAKVKPTGERSLANQGEGRMASSHQVSCIRKDDRQDKYSRITHIGGANGNGSRWRLTLDEAISGIETGKWAFYTHVGGHQRWIRVASRNGRKYLRTEADQDTPDNLLSLPECP